MLDIKEWLNCFLNELEKCFGERLWFVGLQGSYGRGEATDKSDIDTVVILDRLTPSDIKAYGEMLKKLPHSDLLCGFFSGKAELFNWESADLFQFYYDTKPLKGSLDELLKRLDNAAAERAVKIGLCNIYHACVHNMLYQKSDKILKSLYKSASFVLQAIYFIKNGKYVSRQTDLLKIADVEDKEIISIFLKLKSGCETEFDRMSEILFVWAQVLIEQYN